MRKSPFPDFNSAHWNFLVHWAPTVLTGPNLWAEYRRRVGLSTIPPHTFLTHCRTHYKLVYKSSLCEKDLSWKKEYVVLHSNEFLVHLLIMARYLNSYKPLYLCLPISSSLQNQSYNDLQLQRILSLSYNSIFPSRRDEKTCGKMDGTLNLSRDNALLT